jgi:hypothetical protein
MTPAASAVDMVETGPLEKRNRDPRPHSGIHLKCLTAAKPLFSDDFRASPWIPPPPAAFKSIDGVSASLALSAALPPQPCITQTLVS